MTQYLIEEPIGWSDSTLLFKRDVDLHGIFNEYSISLKFYETGYTIIRDEYTTNGVEGYLRLIIEFECSDTDSFEEFWASKINFTKIEFQDSDQCLIEVPIEQDSCLTMLRSRIDQKVDLASNTSLDGEALTDYGLPENMPLAPKTFILESEFDEQPTDIELAWDNIAAPFVSGGGTTVDAFLDKFVQIGWLNIILDEAGISDNSFIAYDTLAEVLPFFIAARTGFYNVDLKISLKIEFGASGSDLTMFNSGNPAGMDTYHIEVILEINGTPTTLYVDDVYGTGIYPPNTTCTPPDSLSITINSIAYTNPTLSLNAGDIIRFYAIIRFGTHGLVNGNIGNRNYYMCATMTMLQDTGLFLQHNYFNATIPTNNGTTLCDVVLVNEALSRTVESITNDCIRVKSDYFGRTDSQPYMSVADGSGSLEALTNGLKIRQRADALAVLKFSFNDIYNGLNAIHAIGMGLEPDTVRGGDSEWLRVEPARYFYDSSVVLICDKVPDIQRKVISQEHYSIFNFGYARWEAEEYNGLDEFCTKRSYRTSLQSVKNTLNQICSFIASGYAVEITKGQGHTTKDWRYDNDQFIICVERTYDGFIVEQDNFTGSGTTLIDPATVYNFRISPIRNLLRWAWKLLSSYVNPLTGKLIFMSGEGNFLAEGLLSTDPIEAASIAENETEITNANLLVGADGLPIYKLEEWSFRYPMSVADYHAVKANPRGIIQVRYGQNTVFHDCYIRSIEYKPVKGEAQFTLLPKYES